MQAPATTSIQREIRIEAPPETVYSYFVDPEKMSHWMAARAQADPRPGGMVRWDMDGFDIARGEYLELVPHSRIVFTWGWESLAEAARPGTTRIEVTLIPDGAGTLLKFVHSGISEAEAAGYTEGWDPILTRLAEAAASGRPAEPQPEPLSEPVQLAASLNTLLCELREILESTNDDALRRTAPGTNWSAGATAMHIVAHCGLAEFVAATARGERSPVADMPPEALDENNAQREAANPNPSRAELLAALTTEGPLAVEALKAIEPSSLGNGQPMNFAGGAVLAARDLAREPLLQNIHEHVQQVRAAVSA